MNGANVFGSNIKVDLDDPFVSQQQFASPGRRNMTSFDQARPRMQGPPIIPPMAAHPAAQVPGYLTPEIPYLCNVAPPYPLTSLPSMVQVLLVQGIAPAVNGEDVSLLEKIKADLMQIAQTASPCIIVSYSSVYIYTYKYIDIGIGIPVPATPSCILHSILYKNVLLYFRLSVYSWFGMIETNCLPFCLLTCAAWLQQQGTASISTPKG